MEYGERKKEHQPEPLKQATEVTLIWAVDSGRD